MDIFKFSEDIEKAIQVEEERGALSNESIADTLICHAIQFACLNIKDWEKFIESTLKSAIRDFKDFKGE